MFIYIADSTNFEDCLGRQGVCLSETSTMWLLDIPQAHNGKSFISIS